MLCVLVLQQAFGVIEAFVANGALWSGEGILAKRNFTVKSRSHIE